MVENWDYKHFHIRISSNCNGSQWTYSSFYVYFESWRNNHGTKDNDANFIDSIVVIIENCCISLWDTTRSDSAIVIGSGKVSGLKHQVAFKQKKLG